MVRDTQRHNQQGQHSSTGPGWQLGQWPHTAAQLRQPQEKKKQQESLWERGGCFLEKELSPPPCPLTENMSPGVLESVGAAGRRTYSGAHVVPFRMPGAHGAHRQLTHTGLGTAPQAVGRQVLSQHPECQRLVAAGAGRGPPPAPGDLAVPDATAGKCVRYLRKSLLCFQKIIITAACHGP